MTDYAKWLRTIAVHVEQNDPVRPCHKALRRAADELESLSSETSLAFRAGYQFGRADAWHNYPPRPKGAYNEWRKAPVSTGQTP